MPISPPEKNASTRAAIQSGESSQNAIVRQFGMRCLLVPGRLPVFHFLYQRVHRLLEVLVEPREHPLGDAFETLFTEPKAETLATLDPNAIRGLDLETHHAVRYRIGQLNPGLIRRNQLGMFQFHRCSSSAARYFRNVQSSRISASPNHSRVS